MVEGDEAHAVGMMRQRRDGDERDIGCRIERDRGAARQTQRSLRGDALRKRGDDVGIDRVGRITRETEEQRAVRAVTAAGQRERTEELDPNARDRRLTPASSEMNIIAARIGPTVCELDGPMPILNTSPRRIEHRSPPRLRFAYGRATVHVPPNDTRPLPFVWPAAESPA